MNTAITGISEVVPFHFEHPPILQVTVHDLHNRLRQAHAQERKRDFLVPVYRPKLEKRAGDDGRVLRTLGQRDIYI